MISADHHGVMAENRNYGLSISGGLAHIGNHAVGHTVAQQLDPELARLTPEIVSLLSTVDSREPGPVLEAADLLRKANTTDLWFAALRNIESMVQRLADSDPRLASQLRQVVHIAHRRLEALAVHELPAVIYLDDAVAAPAVEAALHKVFQAFGLTVLELGEPIIRSWFRRMRVGARRAATGETGRRLYRELDRAVELRAVDQVQAQVDSAQAGAVAGLLTSLEGTQNALVQIGSVLLIKIDGVPLVRNLTQHEIAHLQRNPQLIRDPAAVLGELQRAADHTAISATSNKA
ncbi:hypothetical protein D5S17_28370 [Pseudonocardiaceae bacterium YIM PH 21723]|nr:hypothetical protein D5S17_28370 [Pseudonocardiaceae bacterium YIM PH 21723]